MDLSLSLSLSFQVMRPNQSGHEKKMSKFDEFVDMQNQLACPNHASLQAVCCVKSSIFVFLQSTKSSQLI